MTPRHVKKTGTYACRLGDFPPYYRTGGQAPGYASSALPPARTAPGAMRPGDRTRRPSREGEARPVDNPPVAFTG